MSGRFGSSPRPTQSADGLLESIPELTPITNPRQPSLPHLDPHRLVIRSPRPRLDRNLPQPPSQIRADADEVAAERLRPLRAVVDADGRRLRRPGVQRVPGIEQRRHRRIVERRRQPRVQRIVGPEVEVAGEDRRDASAPASGTARSRSRARRGRRARGRRPRRGARAAPRPGPCAARASSTRGASSSRAAARTASRTHRPRAACAACCARSGRPATAADAAAPAATGSRLRIMLPKRRRAPPGASDVDRRCRRTAV